MGKIISLPEKVKLKIAAGEVIETPASVVKELMENSMDAGANSITLEIKEGGLKEILLRDNGEGIFPEDLPLALERFSTSKIRNEDDLCRIKTFGFRGEALASIAAVSKIKITSKRKGKEGYSITSEGGQRNEILQSPHSEGTTVEVRDLFFNLPARKKFLPSVSSLFREITKIFQQGALSKPSIHFVMIRDGREVVNFPGVNSLKERISQVMGKNFLSSLMEIRAEAGEFSLYGYSSVPSAGRVRPSQIFFLNGRPVKNREFPIALNNSYSKIMEKPRLPEAIIFVKAPVDSYDVNVHPSKKEVRFKNKDVLFRLFSTAVSGNKKSFTTKTFVMERGKFYGETSGKKLNQEIEFGKDETNKRVLGQIRNLYIVVEDQDGLYLIDQHNAEERVIYERLKKLKEASKPLLIPFVIDLGKDDRILFNARMEELKKAGFDFELFSGDSVIIKGIPVFLDFDDAEKTFIEALRGKDKVLATIACKSAVKRGQVLSPERMKSIVDEIFALEAPELCPHGRPTMVKLTWNEIGKMVGRKDK